MKLDKEQLVKVIDFWQKSAISGDLKPRAILQKVNYAGKEIVDFVGPRRSGKSSVLKLIIKRLQLSGNSYLYLNFEDPFFVSANNPQIIEEAIAVFKEYYGSNLKYLFFDEIQAIDNWEKAVRKLRDGADYKIFITGSSSKLLSGEIATLLTGRHLSSDILPLSFEEFLAFRGVAIKDKKDMVLRAGELLKKFDEYLQIGGFPEVVLTNNKELLKNYFFDILQKDVMTRYAIRDKNALENMGVYLMSNTGKIISVESLKEAFNLSFSAATAYLGYLKDAFLVFELPLFSFSLKKQSKAMKKIYAVDTGMVNNVSFKFSEDKGRMLENAVFLELKKKGEKMYYYRTKNNYEVDFAVKKGTAIRELIQVAWSLEDSGTKDREVKALCAALDEQGLKEGSILTHHEEEFLEVAGKRITVKPVYRWVLEKK